METTVSFYALANNIAKQGDMVIVDDDKVSFSKDYQEYLSDNQCLRYVPTISDFKYIKKVEIDKTNVFIFRDKKDIMSGVTTKDGKIDLEKLNKKTHKNYYGYIIFAPLFTKRYAQFFPHYDFQDISKCVKKITLVMKQEPKDRTWVSVEPCKRLTRRQCVISDTCMLRDGVCNNYPPLTKQPLQNLNVVMKPYKYYMFTEFQVNEGNIVFELNKSYVSRKPTGLWFAIGDEWLQHLKKTHFWMTKYNYLYEIELNKDKITTIDTMKALQEFSSKYGVDEQKKIEHKGKTYTFTLTSRIDWYKFMKQTKSQGVIITPNFKSLYKKYNSFNNIYDVFEGIEWYYSWDIASGVVWDTDAIKSLRMVYMKEPGYFAPQKKTQ